MHAELASPSAQPAAVLALPILPLARFRRLMKYEGHDVDLARMCIDADYAYRCLAAAHTSNDERLRCAGGECQRGEQTAFDAVHGHGSSVVLAPTAPRFPHFISGA